jgi:hypothetical protein
MLKAPCCRAVSPVSRQNLPAVFKNGKEFLQNGKEIL